MNTEKEVARYASRQHGLVTRAQALEVGFTAQQIRRRVRAGRWIRARHDVLAVAGSPPTWERTILAAVLAAGPDAVASHFTAAALWGFPDVGREVVEVSTARPQRRRLQGAMTHRTCLFLEVEHATHRMIPVTTVARTLVDLSARLSIAQLGRALDDGPRRNTVTLAALRQCVGGLAPSPGRRPSMIHNLLRARVPGFDPGDSDLEMRVLRAIVAGELPEPELQHWVRLGARRCRIDLAYPDVRLAIEIDGWDTHRMRTAFDEDRARANDLVVAGWHVLRFTSSWTDTRIQESVRAALTALGRKRGA